MSPRMFERLFERSSLEHPRGNNPHILEEQRKEHPYYDVLKLAGPFRGHLKSTVPIHHANKDGRTNLYNQIMK